MPFRPRWSGAGSLLLFIAFILILLVSLSAPIIKSIYFIKIYAPRDSRAFGNVPEGKFGLWGFCVQRFGCSETKYGLGLGRQGTLGFTRSQLRVFSHALILHPIATLFIFLATITSLLALAVKSIIHDFVASFLGFLAFIVILLTFIFDCIIYIKAHHNVRDFSTLDTSYGNAFWMTMVTFLFVLIGSILTCGGSAIEYRRRPRKQVTYAQRYAAQPAMAEHMATPSNSDQIYPQVSQPAYHVPTSSSADGQTVYPHYPAIR